MASESRNRDTIFPGSDPVNFNKESTPSSDYNNPIPRPKVRFAPQVASYGSPSKHITGHGSRDSWTAFPSRPPNDFAGSQRPRIERVTYHEFMVLDQAGSANIGCDNTRERNLVAIKRLKGFSKSSMRGIRSFTSDYVVNIIGTYFDNDDLVIIYEKMDISLRRITSILEGPLKPFQIAAICKELVAGLSYIHEELSLCNGELSCGTILLNLDGMVKIANIGESFVQEKYITAESRRSDVRSLGFVMMELMEPTTYILSPRSTELQSPEKWKDSSGIKDFLRATQHLSLEELKNHDFLPKEPLAKCLKAHIFCALNTAGTHWDILSLP